MARDALARKASQQAKKESKKVFHTPCVAAHSTVRSLYAKYDGALYQVKRASDNATENIGLLSHGYANVAAHISFTPSS